MAWLADTQGLLSFSARMKMLLQGIQAKLIQMFPARPLQQLDLATLVPPDSAVCQAADQLAQQAQDPYLYNHCMRSYVWARLLNGSTPFDHEAFFVAVVLHDLGLTSAYASDNHCFTHAAAIAAHDLALKHQWTEQRADVVANAISLHLNVRIDDSHGREAQLVRLGSGADVIGQHVMRLPKAQRHAVLKQYPRLDFKNHILKDLRQASLHPCCRLSFLRNKLGFDSLVRNAPFDE